MKKLKQSYKSLFILEAGYIYCKRHDIEYVPEKFFNEIAMADRFNIDEFDRICNDLRSYGFVMEYELKEITSEEYEMCVDKFGCE